MENSAEQGLEGETFLIADDYMKSFHPELGGSQPLSALHAKYENGTQLILSEYQNTDGSETKYYRALMEVDMSAFVFREITF